MSLKIKTKNILTVFLTLIFAFGILTTSVLRASAQTSSQNYQIAPVEEQTTEEELIDQQEEVDYFLPYPGLLPDHFLYPLKMIRDRIWLWLTINPLKKADLLLLFADKRLGAGKALIEGNKIELGITTLTKAEKYLERAASQERIANQENKETEDFVGKLLMASLKHKEVLTGLREKLIGSDLSVIDQTLEMSRRVREQVQMLLE